MLQRVVIAGCVVALCSVFVACCCGPVPLGKGGTVQGLKSIKEDVALDLENQYETARGSGSDDTELYTRAGLVAEAWLQAGNNERYRKWKKVEETHGRRAGIK